MEELTLEMLIENIQSTDDAQRAAARDNAGAVGAPAVLPLAKIAASGELEVARAANRAIQNIVYHAGRPALRMKRRPWQLNSFSCWTIHSRFNCVATCSL